MHLEELLQSYVKEFNQQPDSPNELLDYCQRMYVNGELDFHSYRQLFQHLHEEGATSSHNEIETV
ncbi:hypothetical protein N780_03510 [Pontibacillus chungwhensis BH030062]|uniref:YppF-like protein n=2 Tax=Pontibacillus TaxID=289201 RepID=A0A0A2UVH0_9BACI|nr:MULTISPECIES: YppF family protein [Pontibacillus]KGP90748.1 hypothetical protein N780_03510 [Pontibacillus chungwhensis BH030062]QST00787.1 hypothetical protein IMZ31_04210 [Pontibacillus sp. ALD_SL1]GGD17862.1 hypothetical protein GCM10011389_27030 [Pontibacillus salipaludis]